MMVMELIQVMYVSTSGMGQYGYKKELILMEKKALIILGFQFHYLQMVALSLLEQEVTTVKHLRLVMCEFMSGMETPGRRRVKISTESH